MNVCMLCGQNVEANDSTHDKEETPAHLRAWKNIWSWALTSRKPREVARAKAMIRRIDEKLARLSEA